MAGMEVDVDLPHPPHHDVVGKVAIAAPLPGAERAVRRGIEVNDLAEGMHTGIGAAGAVHSDRVIRHPGQRPLQLTLHRAGRRLRLQLPAVKAGAVVFDAERQPDPAAGFARIRHPGLSSPTP